MLYSYFFNMLKVGVPGATQVPQLLVYNLYFMPVIYQPSPSSNSMSVASSGSSPMTVAMKLFT